MGEAKRTPRRVVCLVLFIIFAVRVGSYFYLLPERQNGEEIRIEGIIEQEPEVKGFSQNFRLGRVFVSTSKKTQFHFGERVLVEGRLICYESFRCISGRINKASVKVTAGEQGNPLLKLALKVRSEIQGVYFDSLDREQANLLSGIVLGSNDIDRSFKTRLANVGLTHIIAASGMNVTLFATLLFAVFTWFHRFGLSRRVAVIAAIIAVMGYCFLAGLSPSIIRAGIMSVIVWSGGLFGRKTTSYGGLITAAYLMLWAQPEILFDYGFLLSFASMMGQIMVSNVRIGLPKIFDGLTQIIFQTAAAIMFTFPIVLVGFAKFSLVSMISTILVVVTVEPLMILGGVAGIVGLVLPGMAEALLIPAQVLLNYFLLVVKLLGGNENQLLQVKNFNLLMAVGYYLLLGSVLYYLKHRKVS